MEIGSHLQRMSCYCALMAVRLGLDPDLIRIASRLHDVGMAAVPNAVTTKAGRLAPAERRELEAHPALGHAMLAGSEVELLDTRRRDCVDAPRTLRRRRLPARA